MTSAVPSSLPADLLVLAVDLARRAGALALSMHAGLGASDTKSSPTDVVTAADRATEALLVDGVRGARPDDGVLGEEGASFGGTSGVRWVVDPIDGTVNYLYGLPQWAVSIGVEVDGVTQVGPEAGYRTSTEARDSRKPAPVAWLRHVTPVLALSQR